MKSSWLLTIWALLVVTLGEPTTAATISIRSTVSKDNVVRELDIDLAGEITAGDIDRLRALVDPFAENFGSEFDGYVRLHLNSPGGDYEEGLKVSQYVRAKGIATRVEKGSECDSACAIIFMHGTSRDPDGEESINRKMEIGALIGFHAPYISVKKAFHLSDEEAPLIVSYAYSKALVSLSFLLESGDKIFSEELLIKMLRIPPNEMLYVTTFGDLVTWKIALQNEPEIKALRYEDLVLACLNSTAQDNGSRPMQTRASVRSYIKDDKNPLVRRLGVGVKGDIYQYTVNEYNETQCNLRVRKRADGTLNVERLADSTGQEDVDFDQFGSTLNVPYLMGPDELIVK